jgi:hypothetical protein
MIRSAVCARALRWRSTAAATALLATGIGIGTPTVSFVAVSVVFIAVFELLLPRMVVARSSAYWSCCCRRSRRSRMRWAR